MTAPSVYQRVGHERNGHPGSYEACAICERNRSKKPRGIPAGGRAIVAAALIERVRVRELETRLRARGAISREARWLT